jgi:hypothetical protein
MAQMFTVTPFEHPEGSPQMMVAFHHVMMIEDASFIPDEKEMHKAGEESTVDLEKPAVVKLAPVTRTKITFLDGKTLMVKEPIVNLAGVIG